ncbi:hypothetical protein B0H14DRAFT_2852568, partial [Mycena olivaceomarginata]
VAPRPPPPPQNVSTTVSSLVHARLTWHCVDPPRWSHVVAQTPPETDANVEAFVAALTRKYPRITEFLSIPTSRAEAIAAVSICAEQTFTESTATRKEMGPACSVALDAYVGSNLEREVKNEIARIPPEDDWHAKLVEIIITHRLRIGAAHAD